MFTRSVVQLISVLSISILGTGHTFASIASTQHQHGSYVILGQSPNNAPTALARTVIDTQYQCPSVITMKAGDKSSAINMVPRENPNHFSVLVCEALITFDEYYGIQFSDKTLALPMATSTPEHIQVFGDTGCKLPKASTSQGAKKPSGCAVGTPAQPFKALATLGAARSPDVILHMGDVNYRGTSGDVYFSQKDANGNLQQVKQWPYDAGDGISQAAHCGQDPGMAFYSQSAINASRPDIWENWRDDLFIPAQDLLLAAPWIVARGNHELCSRAGPGFFYFLDSHSNLIAGDKQLSCPAPQVNKSALANTQQIPTYQVNFSNINMVVIDSANACDSFTDSPFQAVYNKVMKDADNFAARAEQPTWLMTHRPIWAVEGYDPGKSTGCTEQNQYGCINQMLQQGIKHLPNKALNENVKLVLTGHMHQFESVSFGDKRPPALIVGSSGVALSGSTATEKVNVDGLPADVLSLGERIYRDDAQQSAFGYLHMSLSHDATWKADLISPKNQTIVECDSAENKTHGVCGLAQGVSLTP